MGSDPEAKLFYDYLEPQGHSTRVYVSSASEFSVNQYDQPRAYYPEMPPRQNEHEAEAQDSIIQAENLRQQTLAIIADWDTIMDDADDDFWLTLKLTALVVGALIGGLMAYFIR